MSTDDQSSLSTTNSGLPSEVQLWTQVLCASMGCRLPHVAEASTIWRSSECTQAFKHAKEALLCSHVLAHYDTQATGEAGSWCLHLQHWYCHLTSVSWWNRAPHCLKDTSTQWAQLRPAWEGSTCTSARCEAVPCLLVRTSFWVGHRPYAFDDHSQPRSQHPSLGSWRLPRRAVTLSTYQYNIQFKQTQDHTNADGLSRLPQDGQPSAKLHCMLHVSTLGGLKHCPWQTQWGQSEWSWAESSNFTQSGWPQFYVADGHTSRLKGSNS